MPDAPRTARLQAVIFDMDGVVTRTARLHARAWKKLFDEYLETRRAGGETHAPFDAVKDYLAWVDGKPRYEGVRSFLEARGIDIPFGTEADGPDDETACGLGNRKDRYFDRLLREEGAEVFESTVTRLKELREMGVRTGLVTSSKHGREVLELAGLTRLFDVIVDGNTAQERGLRGKPDPDIFLEASRGLGTPPAGTAVVEDAVSGIEAGRRGGFANVVAVNRGANREALEAAGADLLVDDLAQISAAELVTPRRRDLPSGLSALGAIAERLAGRRLALFLDYDGTLSPIVARPELARLAPPMKEVLRRLAARSTLAVVSGRALADVRDLVGIEGLVYSGNHGFEIQAPGGAALSREVGGEFLAELARIREALRTPLEAIPGAWAEDKTHSLSVHYRQTPDDRAAEVEAAVDEALAGAPRLRKHYGKKVLEIRPRIPWDKGRAVLWLLEALGLQGPEVLPMYVGDDVTDEDAFRALQGRGLGVLVSEQPRPSHADYRLRDTGEVRAFLEGLCAGLERGGR